MRNLKKSTVLKLLAEMEAVVKKLPEDVRYRRLFVVDDGQGIILDKGICEAAAALGKTVETAEWASKLHREVLLVNVGKLSIWEINGGEAK